MCSRAHSEDVEYSPHILAGQHLMCDLLFLEICEVHQHLRNAQKSATLPTCCSEATLLRHEEVSMSPCLCSLHSSTLELAAQPGQL